MKWRERYKEMCLELLRRFPDREMRASDVLAWLRDEGKIGADRQAVSKVLAELERAGKVTKHGGGSACTWYAIALAPGRPRTRFLSETNHPTERDRLRDAIRHWAVGPHAQWCTTRADCPCDCGAAQEFEARLTARKLVGLGEDEP